MAQRDSKVFFPDDPMQAPQFNDCPRQAETVRRAIHSIVRLCAKCAEMWDEEKQVNGPDAALVSTTVLMDTNVKLELSAVTRMSESGHRAL